MSHQITALTETTDKITISTQSKGITTTFHTDFLVACARLTADRVASMLAIPVDFQIIPYRGEYYQLPTQHNHIVNHLIYPIPNPNLPFLGVHLTHMIDSSVTVGSNAVQGWKREGCGTLNFSLKDTLQILGFSGFWKVTFKHLKAGVQETKNS